MYPLYQAVRVTLRKLRLCPDVRQHDFNQNTLVHDMRCADGLSAAGVAAAGVTSLIREYAKLEELDRPTLLRLIKRIDIGERKIEDGRKVREA